MRRRDFVGLLGGAALVRPIAALAQREPAAVLGFLSSRTAEQAAPLVGQLREGLKQSGYVEGQNLVIEYRYANNRSDALATLAAELVAREVAVIVAGGTSRPAIAATRTIPVVFTTGFDPVAAGLVTSLGRPEGNVTGATFYSGALGGKQAEILRELVPDLATIGLIVNPALTNAGSEIEILQTAAKSIGCELEVLRAAGESEFAPAFAALAGRTRPALVVSVDPLFDSHRAQLIALADQYRIPTIYYLREFAEAGGLVSYGASISDTYRQAGAYAGRILAGARPADLPVQLPTRFELVINQPAVKKLGLTVPPHLLATADEVIE